MLSRALKSAFVSGQLIYDNVLVPYELMHYLNWKRRGKSGFMSLKLDISKTYDSVNWSFSELQCINSGLKSIGLRN